MARRWILIDNHPPIIFLTRSPELDVHLTEVPPNTGRERVIEPLKLEALADANVLVGAGSSWELPAGDEGHNDVRGMTVEVLPPSVIDCRGPWISVSSGNLDVSEGDAGVEGGHDESSSEHVGVDHPESGTLADGPDPTVSMPTIQTMTVLSPEDRTFRALGDDQVESPGSPWHERDDRRLLSLAHDPKGPVPTVEGEVLDVRPTGAHRRPLSPSSTARAVWSGSNRSAV